MTDPRPTRIRYLVVALTMLMSFLLYLDRFCLSMVVGFIREDLRLSDQEVGVLLGAFFWTYALGQVPAGWLSDRFGARLMLTLYILVWSLFTGWLGFVGSFGAVLILRLWCGLAQAGAYPTGAAIVKVWMPFSARATASSLVAIGGRIGGAAAPVLTAYLLVAFVPAEVPSLLRATDLFDERGVSALLDQPGPDATEARRQLGSVLRQFLRADAAGTEGLAELNAVLQRPDLFERVDLKEFSLEREARRLAEIPAKDLSSEQTERRNRLLLEAAFPKQVRKLYGQGWRPVVIIYGLAGLLVAGLFWLSVRNRPGDHPACNAAERAMIHGEPVSDYPVAGRLLLEPLPIRAVLTSVSMWMNSAVQFLVNIGWVFLVTWLPDYLDKVHKVSVEDRGWMTATPIVVGMFAMFGGGQFADWLTRRTGLYWGRMLPIAVTKFTAAAAFFACLWLDSPWPVTIALCVVAASVDLGVPALWAFAQDVSGRHAASVLGWGNMWGNFGAALSPMILAAIFKHYDWNMVFIVCGLSSALAGFCAFFIDASRPLVPPSQV